MRRRLELMGKRFGRWTVIGRTDKKHFSSFLWVCRCDCGTVREVIGSSLSLGKSTSCGCKGGEKTAERNATHGFSSHRWYNTWKSMIHRCHLKTSSGYYLYGARGISVCAEWRESPVLFLEWLDQDGYKSGLQVDRIDNDKGYSPENCRIVEPYINANNRRLNSHSKTSRFVGVCKITGNKTNPYRATICDRRAVAWRGLFPSEEEAAIERDRIIRERFPWKNRDNELSAQEMRQ